MGELSTEVSEELEAMQAIYDSDMQMRPPVWNYPSFSVSMRSSAGNEGSQIKATLKFTLSATYPKTGPKHELEFSQGLSIEEKKRLNDVIDATIKANLNSVMIYEIVSAVQNFIDNDVQAYQEESFYDAMMRREQETKAYVDGLRKGNKATDAGKDGNPGSDKAGSANDKIQDKSKVEANIGLSTAGIGGLEIGPSSVKKTPLTPSRPVAGSLERPAASVGPSVTPAAKKAAPPVQEESTGGLDDEDEDDGSHSKEDALHYDNSKSRYAQEFVELSRIGNGASGEVWKVRHKLDRRIYAVKKIDLNARNNAVGSKIQREVTTISRLIHKNIVRYYAAWIEQYEATNKKGAQPLEAAHPSSTGQSSLSPSKSASGNYWLTGNSFTKEAEMEAWGAPNRADDFEIDFEGSSDGNRDLSNFGFDSNIRPLYYGSSGDDSDSNCDSDSDGNGIGGYSDLSSSSSSSSDDESSSSSSSSDSADGQSDRNSQESLGLDDSESSREAPDIARWMFIQMEYCCTTLREEIDKHELWQNVQEINRLLRQTLEALAYMHKCKVIHRDLKPANIFLDSEQNIKLGDFGLATSNHKRGSEKAVTRGDATMLESMDDSTRQQHSTLSTGNIPLLNDFSANSALQEGLESLTAGIGTALYRAPEQEVTAHTVENNDREYTVPYNEKADMYSLGIILFEMCHKPFSTGMERLVTIKELREQEKIPAEFERYVPENLCKIIRWLTQQNPKQRPSASQLLNSDLMPARVDVDNQYLKEITEALYKPNSTASQQVLAILFDQQKIKTSTFVENGALNHDRSIYFDYAAIKKTEEMLLPQALVKASGHVSKRHNHSVNASQGVKDLSLVSTLEKKILKLTYMNALKRRLRTLFESRGSVDFASQLVELRSSAADVMEEALRGESLVELLDRSGNDVVVQPDLTSSFTRLVALLNITSSHRFCFDRVYSAAHLSEEDNMQVQPFTSEQAVYDVIAPFFGYADVLMADLEILGTVRSILFHLNAALPATAIRLCHTALCEAVVSLCCWEGERCMADMKPNRDLVRKLKWLFSLLPDCLNLREAETLINSQGLQGFVAARVLGLARALVGQDPVRSRSDPLKVLSMLEQEFYSLKEVTKHNEVKETTIFKPEPASTSNKEKEKEKTSSAKAENNRKAADFTQLNFDHIGIKGSGGLPPKKPSNEPLSRGQSKEKEKEVVFDAKVEREMITKTRRDRGSSLGNSEPEIVAEWAKLFEKGRQHLRDVLHLLALQKSVRELLNAKSDLGNLSILENNLEMAGNLVVIDLGVDLLSTQSALVRPFASEGILFVVEAYNIQQPEGSSMTPSVAVPSKDSKKNGKQSVVGSTNASGVQVSSGTPLSLKRYKRNFGLLIDGGHFEKLVADRRAQVRGRLDAGKIIACGFRVHLENMASIIHKFEWNHRQSTAHVGHTERLIALVISSFKHKDSEEEKSMNPAHNKNWMLRRDAKSLVVVTNWLHANQIRASSGINQLQGHTALSPSELCHRLDIPVLICVDSEHYDHVDVQIMNTENAQPATVTLQQLPGWIRSHVSPDFFQGIQIPIATPSQVTSGNPIAVTGAAKSEPSTTNATVVEDDDQRIFAITIVNSSTAADLDIFGNKKRKRELDSLLSKASSAMSCLLGTIAVEKNVFRPFNDVFGRQKLTGYVQIIDVPFSVLRTMNTLLMTKSTTVTTFKTEFEGFLAQNSSTAHRRALKNYLASIITLMQSLLNKAGTTGKPSSTTKPTGGKSTVFAVSSVDDSVDMVILHTESIVQLRSM